ncbi:hypothetical protein M9434_003829 [Picochlorum sp. BPE23]|nr:hypothetical protein M9434_003829 [Picochlorum sp. BPE23]
MFAKLVGEGFDKPDGEQELPIDINYAKLVEWVVDRKVVPQDWKSKLEIIQKKAEAEAKGLPPGFLAQFTGAQEGSMNYFRCAEILNKMKETAERGMLGSLKGDAGKWEKIVKAYESNMIHVAEGGLIMARNVDYEIPYLRKQTARNQQQIEDLERKSAELVTSAAVSKEQFAQECERIGIPTLAVLHADALDAQLLLSAEGLPRNVSEACNFIKSHEIKAVIEYYQRFVAQQTSYEPVLLTVLADVVNGCTDSVSDAMVQEWADIPKTQEHEAIVFDTNDVEENSGNAIEVSWDGLDMGLDLPEADAEPSSEQPLDISWDIDVSGVGEACESTEHHGDHAGADSQSNAYATRDSAVSNLIASLEACDTTTKRLTVDTAYRNQLLDDLLELKAFISQRYRESKNQSASMTGLDVSVDAPTLEKMLQDLDKAINLLTAEDLAHHVSIVTNALYRERLAKNLVKLSQKEAKQMAASKEADVKKEDVRTQLMSDSAKISALVRDTKQIKEAVEISLGNKLKRRINIQGAIHNVLKQ